ncbi:MAG: SDR family oxidoreductase [Anaerolineales bacterium]|nr:SDR family oxidoreductase [Anaerolineales bacterium]
MRSILITGASGLLGSNLALEMSTDWKVTAQYYQHQIASDRFACECVDLSVEGAAEALLQRVRPDVVIHCAALTHVDTCEKQPDLAFRLNAKMPGLVAAAAKKVGAYLVHISTDAVFDGEQGGYRENDPVHPVNIYARSKVEGEEQVLAENANAAVLRVNIFGWNAQDKFSLAEWFLDKLEQKHSCKGFTDVFITPTLVNALVPLLEAMAGTGTSGIVHAAGADCVSKYEFGVRIAQAFALDSSVIEPSTVEEAGLLAVRGRRLCLKSERMESELGIFPLDLESALQKMCSLRENGYKAALQDLTTGGRHERI